MKTDYTAKYLKIYFWQGAAFVLRFLSMFIVTPYLTSQPAIYGIYAVCLSVTIFLNYADLGFLRAGQKYAAECYARDDRAGEMRFIGFGAFVLLLFAFGLALLFIYMGFHPGILIKGLDTPDKVSTASKLLFLLAVFTPATVLQRVIAMIFEIRLDGYVAQRISLCASLVTISSVFYFFRDGEYGLVPYFFFSQFVSFLSVIVSAFAAKRKYAYSFGQLLRCVRFAPLVYQKVSRLAYSGLYGIVVWVAFYELDQIAIARLLGADRVAIYAVAFSFAVLFRTVFSILFSPFVVRANYFVGKGDDEGLRNFSLQLFSITAPIVLIPPVAFALFSKPFILTWVGPDYLESIALARILALVFAFSFVSYTGSMLLLVKERVREMNVIATVQPILYWTGVTVTFHLFGLLAFASFKLLATLVSEACYLYILVSYFEISLKTFLKNTALPLLLSIGFLLLAFPFLDGLLPVEKSKINFLIVVGTFSVVVGIAFIFQYVFSPDLRRVTARILNGSTKGVSASELAGKSA